MRSFGLLFFYWMIVATFLVGCSRGLQGPPTAPVHGTVTFQGKPVEGAQVAFFCPQAGGRPAIGKTDAEGHYTLSTFGVNDGALIGRHSATISKFAFDRSTGASDQKPLSPPLNYLPPDAAQGRLSAGTHYALPWKYSDVSQSGLTADVEPEGSEVNFNLQEMRR